MDVIDKVEDGNALADVAFYNKIDKSMVTSESKREGNYWWRLLAAPTIVLKESKVNQAKKRFVQLYQKFDVAWSKNMKVSYSWLYTKTNIYKESEKDSKRLSPSVFDSFLRQYIIKLRRLQRIKLENKETYAPELMKWYITLSE